MFVERAIGFGRFQTTRLALAAWAETVMFGIACIVTSEMLGGRTLWIACKSPRIVGGESERIARSQLAL